MRKKIYVKSQNAGSAALTALKTAKTDKVSARDKFEELDVQNLKADDDDTQHQHIIIIKNKPDVSKKNAVEFNISKQI